MKLLNAKGLSNNLVSELQKKIEEKAKDEVGEVRSATFVNNHGSSPQVSFISIVDSPSYSL